MDLWGRGCGYGRGRGGRKKIGSVLFLISAVLTVVVWPGLAWHGGGEEMAAGINLGLDQLGGLFGILGGG